jgi:hypothetical protein
MTRLLTVSVFALLLILLTVGDANSQDLPIGSMWLSIGMKQADVWKEMNARFQVVPMEGKPISFVLLEAEPSRGQTPQVLGMIAFENERVSWIQRRWGWFYGQVNAAEVGRALFSAIESATSASGQSATITTKVSRVPGSEFKSLEFLFPNRKISILSSEGDAHGGPQLNIDESVFSKRQ